MTPGGGSDARSQREAHKYAGPANQRTGRRGRLHYAYIYLHVALCIVCRETYDFTLHRPSSKLDISSTCWALLWHPSVSVPPSSLSAPRLFRAGPTTTPTGLLGSLVASAAFAAGRGWAVFREVPLQTAREAALGRIRRLGRLGRRAVLGEVPLQLWGCGEVRGEANYNNNYYFYYFY